MAKPRTGGARPSQSTFSGKKGMKAVPNKGKVVGPVVGGSAMPKTPTLGPQKMS